MLGPVRYPKRFLRGHALVALVCAHKRVHVQGNVDPGADCSVSLIGLEEDDLVSSIDDGETSSTAVIPRGGYSCAGDDMKLMIFRQEGFQVPGRFPRLFLIRENPAIAPRGAQNPCSPSSHLVCCGNASSSQFMAGQAIRTPMVASQATPLVLFPQHNHLPSQAMSQRMGTIYPGTPEATGRQARERSLA